MRIVVLVMRVQGARAAHDLLVAAMPAGGVDANGDRLVGLVGDDDSLTHLAHALGLCVHWRQWLPHGTTAVAGGRSFGAFLQATSTAAGRLRLALGYARGVALLRRANRARLAGVRRARFAPALLGGELLGGFGLRGGRGAFCLRGRVVLLRRSGVCLGDSCLGGLLRSLVVVV